MVEELSTDMIKSAHGLLIDLNEELVVKPIKNMSVTISLKNGSQVSGKIFAVMNNNGIKLRKGKSGWIFYSSKDIEHLERSGNPGEAASKLKIKISKVMGELREALQLLRLGLLGEEQRLAFASLSHSRLAHEASVADGSVDVIGSVGEKLRQVTKEQIHTAKEKYSHIDPIINFARIVGGIHDDEETEETDNETKILLYIYRQLADVTRRELYSSPVIDNIGLLKLSSELLLPLPEPEPELEPEPESETISSAVVDTSKLIGGYKNIKRRNKLKKIKSKKRKKIKSKKLKKIKSKKIKLNKHKNNKSNYKKTRRNKG